MSKAGYERNPEHERLVRLFLDHPKIRGKTARRAAEYIDGVSYGRIYLWIKERRMGEQTWQWINEDTLEALQDFLGETGSEAAG